MDPSSALNDGVGQSSEGCEDAVPYQSCAGAEPEALRLSLERFPSDPEALEAVGIPWGCVVQPAINSTQVAVVENPSSSIKRCDECNAYINAYCEYDRRWWRCSLCGARCSLRGGERYHHQAQLDGLPELRHPYVEYDMALDKGAGSRLVYLILVDLSCAAQAREALRSNLEKLPRGSWIGLVAFGGSSVAAYDLRSCTRAHVIRTAVISGKECAKCHPPLQDAIPLDRLLVQVGAPEWRAILCLAFDSLKHKPNDGSAALVAALSSAIDLLANAPPGADIVGGRVLLAVTAAAVAADGSPPHVPSFYDSLGQSAGESGVCVDSFLLPSEPRMEVMGTHTASVAGGSSDNLLDSATEALLPLAQLTGGGLVACFPGTELQQQLLHRLEQGHAWCTLLRVRTSPEFRVAEVHGHALPAPKYENLWYLAGCAPGTTVAIDFEFAAPSFCVEEDVLPSLQIAISYTCLSRQRPPMGENGSTPLLPCARRRLRVFTAQVELARSSTELFCSADAEAIVPIFVHRISRSLREHGDVDESQRTVTDWLAFVLAQYAKATGAPVGDVSFGDLPALAPLPRCVYGFLQSPIFGASQGAALRWVARGAHLDPPELLSCLMESSHSHDAATELYGDGDGIAAVLDARFSRFEQELREKISQYVT